MAGNAHLLAANGNYDEDSGGDSDVPGSLSRHMNNEHARSLAYRRLQAPPDSREEINTSNRYLSKFETTFDARNSDSVVTSVQDLSIGLDRYNQTSNSTNKNDTNEIHRSATVANRLSSASIANRMSSNNKGDNFLQQHKRSKSDGGTISYQPMQAYNIDLGNKTHDEDVLLFCEDISTKLICQLCKRVFRDPVITTCGHTFCQLCVTSNSLSQVTCPADGTKLSSVVHNLAVSEQIGELNIHCKYGCSPSQSGNQGEYQYNKDGCPVTMKLSTRSEHESTCQYAPVKCPNSSLCRPLLKMDLSAHLLQCEHIRCPNHKFNCKFEGTKDEIIEHMNLCRFEDMKEFLEHTEGQIHELKEIIARKDSEVELMKGLFSQLTDKIDRLEKSVEKRIDLLDTNLTKLSSDFIETRRCLIHIEKEVSSMDSRTFNMGAFDVQSVLKCKGTFVGHKGPVWSLCVFSSLLFSGSSDNAIKVWDTRSNYKCINTFNEHAGMVLTLCAYRGKLYSGSADCTISVFDIENLKLIQNFSADDNPICTLAVGNEMLFSGSLKSIKVWDLEALKCVRVLGGLNHWIRALCTTENYLYCGSYQTIKIWDLKTLEQVRVIPTQGGSVYSMVVSREYIICGTFENCIHIWDVKTYKSVARLTGHTGTIYDLALMTLVDTTRVISASYDGSLRVWSLDNLQCVQTMFRHQEGVTALAVGRGRLFSGSVDSTVKVWQ